MYRTIHSRVVGLFAFAELDAGRGIIHGNARIIVERGSVEASRY